MSNIIMELNYMGILKYDPQDWYSEVSSSRNNFDVVYYYLLLISFIISLIDYKQICKIYGD